MPEIPDLLFRAFPLLQKTQAHVWSCDLDRAPDSENSVSADERKRAARFHFERDQTRFLRGRGVLRLLLARYLNASPEDLEFEINAHGKPELPDYFLGNPQILRFNVSHSQNRALFAFGWDFDIGVDIEFQRADCDAEKTAKLAARFFTPEESRALSTLDAAAMRTAFFQLWTRKEALLKAVGTGVSGGLARFEISVLPHEKPRVLAPPNEADDWHLFDLEVEPEYSGALAVKTKSADEYSVCRFEFPDEA